MNFIDVDFAHFWVERVRWRGMEVEVDGERLLGWVACCPLGILMNLSYCKIHHAYFSSLHGNSSTAVVYLGQSHNLRFRWGCPSFNLFYPATFMSLSPTPVSFDSAAPQSLHSCSE